MINCETFNIQSSVQDGSLVFVCTTDLPLLTRVIVSVYRVYKDEQGDQYRWTSFGEAFYVEETSQGRGFSSSLSIESFDRESFKEYQEIGPEVADDQNIGGEIHIRMSVGARQRLKNFGRNNSALNGGMVKVLKGLRIVEAELQLLVPLNLIVR